MAIKPVATYACPQCGYERTVLKSELNDLYPSKTFTCHLCNCKYELILALFANVINLDALTNPKYRYDDSYKWEKK